MARIRLIRAIAEFVESELGAPYTIASGRLAVGWWAQDHPDRSNVFREAPGSKMHFDLPDRIDKILEVLSRSKSYDEAETDAMTILEKLHGRSNMKITVGVAEYDIQTMESIEAPQHLRIDEKRRHVFSTAFIFFLDFL